MIATVANMRKILDDQVFAYSRETGEEYSANPGDYWDKSDDYTLKDEISEPMVLVRRVTEYVEVEESDPVDELHHTGKYEMDAEAEEAANETTTVEVPVKLVGYIREWNRERDAIEDLGDDELGKDKYETEMEEANRDSAIDLLHSIAMQLDAIVL